MLNGLYPEVQAVDIEEIAPTVSERQVPFILSAIGLRGGKFVGSLVGDLPVDTQGTSGFREIPHPQSRFEFHRNVTVPRQSGPKHPNPRRDGKGMACPWRTRAKCLKPLVVGMPAAMVHSHR